MTRHPGIPRRLTFGRRVALGFVFVWFLVGGIAHFAFTELEMRIVPPMLPWPRAIVLVSGALELLGAAGLLWWRTRRFAGWGLIALTVAVTPANVYMLLEHESFAVPVGLLILRLPLQLVLLGLIWWSTRPSGMSSGASDMTDRLAKPGLHPHPVTSAPTPTSKAS